MTIQGNLQGDTTTILALVYGVSTYILDKLIFTEASKRTKSLHPLSRINRNIAR